MKVGVVVYAVASRTYEVEVPDGLTGDKLQAAIDESDVSKWRHIEDWDEEPDLDGNRYPAGAYLLDDRGEMVDPDNNLLEVADGQRTDT